MTSVRRTVARTRTFKGTASKQAISKTQQALREHNGPQKPGCQFTPSSLNKTCFCGEELSICPFDQRQLRSSRRPRASVHPHQRSQLHARLHARDDRTDAVRQY